MNETLTFDDRFKGDVLEGRKTSTLRYEADESLAGRTVTAVTPNGDEFAKLNVVEEVQLTASIVADCMFAGHKNYQTEEDVVMDLKEYYPEIADKEDPELTLFVFQLVYEV